MVTKTILITGAGTGLGKELAFAYSRLGHTIILTGRRPEPLQQVEKEIQANGGKAFTYLIDVTNYEDLVKKVEQIVDAHDFHVLINNAGAGCFGPLNELQIKQINECIMTNVNGTIYMSKASLPFLSKVDNSKVLNIISTACLKGKVNESVYVASKYAIRGFTESLQKEWEGKITFKAVYMGGMDTPFWENTDHIADKTRLKDPKAIAEKIVQLDEEGQIEIVI